MVFKRKLGSGPRNQTPLSSLSSNSSFTECVRNTHSLVSSYHPPISNNVCPASPVQDQTFIKYKCDGGSGTHSFKHCSWDNNGLTSAGGAIHIVFSESQSSISLSVSQCIFLHCHETSTDGGAVYARNIASASVSDSLFFDCECGTQVGKEGGGICLNGMSEQPLIKLCSFVSCMSADDGGGCGIYTSKCNMNYAINSCCFIKCKSTHRSNGEGGGICIYTNKHFITCTNCLLRACETLYQGGGIWMDFPSSTTLKPITFCFFQENKAGSGIDVFLRGFSSSSQAIIHSFSFESSTGRVKGGSDDWLP